MISDERRPSVDRLKEVLNYDEATGMLYWKAKPNRRILVGAAAGSVLRGRYRVSIDGIDLFSHHIAWCIFHGKYPSMIIDHINGNPLDNRIANLREVTPQGNSQNMRKPGTLNTSGFLGVTRTRNGGWKSEIKVNGKPKYLGTFSTPEDAHQAYVFAKRIYHKTCTI